MLVHVVQILIVLGKFTFVIPNLSGRWVLVPPATLVRGERVAARILGGNHRFEPIRYGKVVHTASS
jgi:hypothetical protein